MYRVCVRARVCVCVVTCFSTALLWIVFYGSCDQQEKGGVVLAAFRFCLMFLLLLL